MLYRMVKSLSFDNKLLGFFFIIFIISFRIFIHGFIFTFMNLFFMFVRIQAMLHEMINDIENHFLFFY